MIIFPLLNRVNGNWLTANSFKYSNLKTNRIVYYNENFFFNNKTNTIKNNNFEKSYCIIIVFI